MLIDFEPEYMLKWPATPMDVSYEPEETVPPPLSTRVGMALGSGEQPKIPKPAGEVGRPGSSRKGYSLADVLQWEDGLLEAVQVSSASSGSSCVALHDVCQTKVTRLASKYLDDVTISRQPLEKLQKVYKEVRICNA